MSKADEFIRKHTKNCSNVLRSRLHEKGLIEEIYNPWLTPDQSRKAVEIARDEMVEKAIKWVEYNNENGGCKFDGWVENIKQAMKDGTTKR